MVYVISTPNRDAPRKDRIEAESRAEFSDLLSQKLSRLLAGDFDDLLVTDRLYRTFARYAD